MPDLAITLLALAASLGQTAVGQTAAGCGGSWLGGGGSPSTLEQHASVIVVGTAKPCTPANDACFSIQTERVIKGALEQAGSSLTVDLGNPCSPAPRRGHGIWFLAEDKVRRSVFVMPDSVMFAAPEGPINPVYEYSYTAPVNDKLAAELSSAVEAAAGRNPRGFDGLDMDVLRSGAIDDLKSPVTKILWTRLSQSKAAPERLLGLAGLIRGGSIDAVVTAAKEAEALAPSQQEFIVLLRSIVDGFHPADEAAVVTLGQIAIDQNERLDIRQATGHALAASKSPAAIPYLQKMAGESDKTLRLESAVGLNDAQAMRRVSESR